MDLPRKDTARRLELLKLRGLVGGGTLAADLSAASTVALVGLPQCLAYALMSGMPPIYGLVTALVPGFVAAIVGKSPHVVTGPTNTTGLLILAALTPFLGSGGLLEPSGLGALAALTLLAGLVRLVAALLGGSTLVDFIPESVLAGFTAGAGVLITMMQLDELLGLANVRGHSLVDQLRDVYLRASSSGVGWGSIALGTGTAIAIAVAKRRAPKVPVPLLAVALATGVSMWLGLDASRGLPVVADRAGVTQGWPPFALPSLDPGLWRELLGPASAIALLGTIELAVSARRGGARPDMRREIVAQGAANVAGAFVGAFPASASLARSALLELGGAQTRLAPAAAALVMLPVVYFGGDFVGSMPLASLAGVLFAVALSMVDLPRMRRMWSAAPATRVLLATTFVATLALPLEWAIFSGVGLGLAHHLATTRAPRIERLVPQGSRLVPYVPVPGEPPPSIVVLEVSGDCHFAATGALLRRIEELMPEGTEQLVVDLSHAHALRFAALLAFEDLARHLSVRGAELSLAGVDEGFARLLRGTGSKLRAQSYASEPQASVRSVLERLGVRDSTGTAGTDPSDRDTERHSQA